MKQIFDVWLTATTNSCVSFVSKLDGVEAENAPEAGAKAIEFGLSQGLKMTPMLGAPPIPVLPICIVPFRIEVSSKVTLSSSIPKA